VLRTAGFHGIATFDGAEKKLLIFGSHSEGAYSLGHWMPKAAKEIEGSFTVTRADGSRDKHTGRFEILSKVEYTYTVDDDHTYRFTRK
jgi:predicted alpha/beta hydrolase family esterase